MKRIILIALVSLAISKLFGQTEKATSKTASDSFVSHFNADEFEAVFNSFDGKMQKALPLEKTLQFLTSLKSQAGKISKREFLKYEQNFASYKTKFERGIFVLNISIDSNSNINGLLVRPFKEDNPQKNIRNSTKLNLPFKGEWTVIWGGDTKELNYHVAIEAQKNAFDIVVTDTSGKSFRTDGKTNEDYYAFGKELIAPCNGEVVLVVDGIKDNKPGELNPIYIPGNTVIIKTANNEYLFLAHFKQHSIKVKQGQIVKQGQLLGLCGNSGNSSESHLHFHIQNAENMVSATGIKCYFDKIIVNGQSKSDYSPIQKDRIKAE